MAATSFSAFWAGPDKFSFSTLYHQTQCISDYSRQQPAALYNQPREGDALEELNPYFDASSSDVESSMANAPPLVDSTDSDYSDHIWGGGGDISDSSGASAFEQDDGDYSEYEHNNARYAMMRGGRAHMSPFRRYTPMTMPSFVPRPAPSFSTFIEPQVQPHYFYLPPTNAQLQAKQSSAPLTISHDASTTSSLPNLSSPSTGVLTSSTAGVSKPSAAPLRRRVSKKQAKHQEDDDDYRAEEEENIDAMEKSCRVQNCLVCSRDLPESLRVAQPSWAAILRIVFYTLKVNYPQKEFFNLRSHVYDFVDGHWERICIGKVKSEHWKKQLQDTLAHNKKLFASGAEVYKQKGFWRLDDLTDPWDDGKTGLHNSSNTNVLSSSLGASVSALPTLDSGMLLGGSSDGTLASSMDNLGADDEDDEYSPAPRRHRKSRAYKKAKFESQT